MTKIDIKTDFKGKEWYERAATQRFDTLNAFIEDVKKDFPGYIQNMDEEELEKRYNNGIIAGILISLAAFHATSNEYRYSCNQAGVVRNCVYSAVFLDYTPFDQI